MLNEHPLFEEIITAFANWVYARSEYQEDKLLHYYTRCNRLNVVPDILARSSILGYGENHNEVPWLVHWQPGPPLPIERNEDEATVSELEIALVHTFHFHYSHYRYYAFIEFRTVDAPSEKEPGDAHLKFALYSIASCLSKLNLGLLDGALFLLDEDRCASVPDARFYWTVENDNRRLDGLKHKR